MFKKCNDKTKIETNRNNTNISGLRNQINTKRSSIQTSLTGSSIGNNKKTQFQTQLNQSNTLAKLEAIKLQIAQAIENAQSDSVEYWREKLFALGSQLGYSEETMTTKVRI